ncbi:MAG TPA: hypothetical protein VKT49_21740 [Bryobacteraceae bacterium]|nr:hypothetical protein [Bryobacteraceae bacterium]
MVIRSNKVRQRNSLAIGLALLAAFGADLPAAVPEATFSHDVAPILYRHCTGCHHAGAVAPFPLVTYQDVAKRAQLVVQVTANHYMPPWLPSAPHFQNERRLSQAEIATLQRWAAAGAPPGNPAETPAAPAFTSGWPLGPPDRELEMRAPFTVPAEGPDLYQCFVIPLAAPSDHYVRTIDIHPGNAAVVHHALLFQNITRQARGLDTGSGYPCFGTPGFLPARGLGGWTPGKQPVPAPPGMAETLYAGADLVLQIHYHPTGKPETDRTRVALYFTLDRPRRHFTDIGLGSNLIDIPPGEAAYRVTDHFTVPVPVDVIGVIAHAHYICKDMRGDAVLPGGAHRTLLHIPDWNFNWQEEYRYPAPIRLPAGTRLEMTFTYDNSDANPRNPNHPPQRVVYGPATTDEMAGLHFEVVPVTETDAGELGQALWGKMMRTLGGGVYRNAAGPH